MTKAWVEERLRSTSDRDAAFYPARYVCERLCKLKTLVSHACLSPWGAVGLASRDFGSIPARTLAYQHLEFQSQRQPERDGFVLTRSCSKAIHDLLLRRSVS